MSTARISRPCNLLFLPAAMVVCLSGCGIDPNRSFSENRAVVQKNLTSRTGLQGCGAGAALGALGGLIFGGDPKEVLIGAAGGAIVGCTAGGTLNARREQFKTEAAFFDNQLKVATEMNEALADYQEDVRGQIEDNASAIAALSLEQANATVNRDVARNEYDEAQSSLADASERLKLAKHELDVQRQALSQHAEAPAGEVDPATLAAVSSEVAEMQAYVDELEGHVTELAGQRDTIGKFV